jgi:general secretion pathway protein G
MRKKFSAPQHSRGFTLLEMLAVIVLLGIVATIVVRQVGGNVEKGKYGAGKAQMASLSMKIESYAMDIGSPPKSLADLATRPAAAKKWTGPYAKPSDLQDPFGNPFAYRAPGEHGPFDLTFLGRDGQPGGEGYNADFGNWE